MVFAAAQALGLAFCLSSLRPSATLLFDCALTSVMLEIESWFADMVGGWFADVLVVERHACLRDQWAHVRALNICPALVSLTHGPRGGPRQLIASDIEQTLFL